MDSNNWCAVTSTYHEISSDLDLLKYTMACVGCLWHISLPSDA